MSMPPKDRDLLRRLGTRIAEIADLPVQSERAIMWQQCNDLQHVKPMIWINEIPWHEMDVNDELKIQATDPFCRGIEGGLRRTIYQWEHLPGDMIIEGKLYSPLVIHDSGFGLSENSDVTKIDPSGIASRSFHPQIQEEKDIKKIKMPEITYDEEATERIYQQMLGIFSGIIPVEKRGIPGQWFAPWDYLITLWGVQQAMMDMILRPELVHNAMDHLVNAYCHRLDQYEELNLLSRNDNNTRIGSGGYGYSDELPQDDFDPAQIRTVDIWGCATAQIFSEVSPEMHEEFALRYERRWLDRFGLTYYGCCEPLDIKMSILREVPNLRKISMSPWVDIERGADELQDDYVFSWKPNPEILGRDTWHADLARKTIRETLEKLRGCVVEIIMKDISTVRYDPRRLWEWASIAEEEAQRFPG